MLQLLMVVGRALAMGLRGHRELVLENLALRRAVSTDIVNFPGRVLVIQAPRLLWNGDLVLYSVLVSYSCDARSPILVLLHQTHRVHGVHVDRWSGGRID